MAASLQQVREALALALANVETGDIQASPYYLDAPTPPTLMVVGPVDETTGASFGDTEEMRVLVRGIVSGSMDSGGQQRLDRWWAPTGRASVQAAIEADVTLGGVVESAHVESKSGYGFQTIDQVGRCLTCDWTIYVLT